MKALLIALAVLVAGCASTASVEEFKHPKTAKTYYFSGRYNPTSENLDIFVNGQTVLSGKAGTLSFSNLSGGEFEGKPVAVSCRYGFKFFSWFGRGYYCTVFFDGEKMEEELSF